MSIRYLQCRFLSYWHPGTGGGLGAQLDARARTLNGLPVVPGRTLKGVLRDATQRAEDLGWFNDLPAVEEGWTKRLFGHPADKGPSVPGRLRFGSAELDPATVAAYLALDDEARRAAARGMRADLHQTSLNADGVAHEGSLRGMEVYVPMPLVASIEWMGGPSDPEAVQAFNALVRSLALVEGLGAHRTRGLGRVELSLEDRP